MLKLYRLQKYRLEVILFWTVNLHRHVLRHQIGFHGVFQHLFEVVKGTKLELPVLVASFYGLRRGEVLGLKWDAIDFERGTLTIKRTVTSVNVGGKTQVIEQESAKTKSSMRTLPLVGRFKEYFAEVKAAQELNKQVCGNCYNYEYDGFVFVDELGERMKPDYLTSQFPAFIRRHGMKKMRFHDLRHPYVKPTTKKYLFFLVPMIQLS